MQAAQFDLVVRGGTVVSPGRREIADVGVRNGRIAQLGGTMTGRDELDARGLLVIPGGVDAHVHLVCAALASALAGLGEHQVWVDDFWTGSLAAIAGGITTVGNMTFALAEESMTAAIARDMAGATTEAAVDWFLHPVLTPLGDQTASEIAELAAAGHTSVKVFLSDPRFAAGTPGLAEAVAAAGKAGRGRYRLQRPRTLDAGGQARPCHRRGHRTAGRRGPGDAHADAVLRRRHDRADLT
jgi:dihydropyrimidinase